MCYVLGSITVESSSAYPFSPLFSIIVSALKELGTVAKAALGRQVCERTVIGLPFYLRLSQSTSTTEAAESTRAACFFSRNAQLSGTSI